MNRGVNPDILSEKVWIGSGLKDSSYLPSFEELAAVFGGNHDAWNNYWINMEASGEFFCEFFTREYISGLAVYLQERISDVNTARILEVGAGTGRLSHHLRAVLKEQGVSPNILATDSGEHRTASHLGVERMDYAEALRTYIPEIVLCSWLPHQEDWTKAFRETPSVREYILIGENGYGNASGTKETWDGSILKADGFEWVSLGELKQWQINCMTWFDAPELGIHSTSSTISFRRVSDIK